MTLISKGNSFKVVCKNNWFYIPQNINNLDIYSLISYFAIKLYLCQTAFIMPQM